MNSDLNNNSNNDLNNAFDNEVQIDNNPTSESSNISNNNVNESTSIPPVQTTSNVPNESQNINNTEENKTIDNNKVNNSDVNVANTSTKNDKKNNIMIPILVCVLVLVIVFGFGYYFIGNNSNKTSNDNTEINKEEKKSEYRITSNSLENFDLYFLQLENNEKNMVYSPLSIKYALEMLEEGANGETKEQISNIIGAYEAKKYINSENMSFANAMFIRNTFKDSIKEDYTNSIRNKFNGEVILDDFTSANNINTWVSDKTLKLIGNLLSDDDVKSLDYALINALAIDMEWKNVIQPKKESWGVSYSHEKSGNSVSPLVLKPYTNLSFNANFAAKAVDIGAIFNNYNIIEDLGEENIRKTVGDEYKKWLDEDPCSNASTSPDVNTYLNSYISEIGSNYGKHGSSTDFMLYTDDNVKVFAKDLKEYNGITIQYVGIMPTNVGLKDYINDLNSDKLNNIINNLKELKLESFKDGVITQINGTIPLFKYEYDLDLIQDLKKLGIVDVFDSSKSDLSNISEAGGTISQAKHKANIEFSNEGIKASAATAVGGAGAAGCGFDYVYDVPVEKIDLTFDKPYMYIIRDKNTGEVWFIGSVYEPVEYKLDLGY